MNTQHHLPPLVVLLPLLLGTAATATAQDWPQRGGPHRDAHAVGFQTPKSWPAQLTRKWQTNVGRGFGSVIGAGNALLALTPQAGLTVFEPSDKEFKKLATYQVAAADNYADPIAAGRGIYIKDKDSLALWSLE